MVTCKHCGYELNANDSIHPWDIEPGQVLLPGDYTPAWNGVNPAIEINATYWFVALCPARYETILRYAHEPQDSFDKLAGFVGESIA